MEPHPAVPDRASMTTTTSSSSVRIPTAPKRFIGAWLSMLYLAGSLIALIATGLATWAAACR